MRWLVLFPPTLTLPVSFLPPPPTKRTDRCPQARTTMFGTSQQNPEPLEGLVPAGEVNGSACTRNCGNGPRAPLLWGLCPDR